MAFKNASRVVLSAIFLMIATPAISAMAAPSQTTFNGRLASYQGAKPMQNATLDFELVNNTGFNLSGLYLGPTGTDSWGDNILEEDLESGQSVDISFHPEAEATKWDLRADWSMEDEEDSQEYVYWIGLSLDEISRLTLSYNKSTGKTSAKAE